jgi:hypothetical protein
VKNGKEADFGAQMLGIGSNGPQRCDGGAEENAVDGAFILQSDGGNLLR